MLPVNSPGIKVPDKQEGNDRETYGLDYGEDPSKSDLPLFFQTSRLGCFFFRGLFHLLGGRSGLFRSLVRLYFRNRLSLALGIGVSEDKLAVASSHTRFGHFFIELVVIDFYAVLDHVDHIFGLSRAGHAMNAAGFAHIAHRLA